MTGGLLRRACQLLQQGKQEWGWGDIITRFIFEIGRENQVYKWKKATVNPDLFGVPDVQAGEC